MSAEAVRPMSTEEKKVIFASSLGTIFEWYDFYLYGSLAAIISQQFFSGVNETAAFIFALMAFAAGFAVRPFGALVFGRLGDLVGRKHTFLVTILIMGIATFGVGLLPSYASIGIAAPIILVGLRLLQGLALGGEYGGAATYVAEHAPNGKRGFYTSWIQTTATIGLFLSLLVILGVRTTIGEKAFADWGWRIPFLLSVIMLGISVWIRMQLSESPTFKRMKEEGRSSKSPLRDSFTNWKNGRLVLIALFGLVAGQAVTWYTAQFYALFFLTQTLKVDAVTANVLVAIAILLATPLFILFGWLSDRIGRKPIIMTGLLGAALCYFPVYSGLTAAANPALLAAQTLSPIVVVADPNECSFQFNPVGTAKFKSSCDIAKSHLAKSGLNYQNESAPVGTMASVRIGDQIVQSYDGSALDAKDKASAFSKNMSETLKTAKYPLKADPTQINKPMIVALLFVLMLFATMAYGPLAAILVEMFPTKIRYTSMSLPYHIGNGWFGGFLPTVAFAMVAAKGNIYQGLWYPIVIALMTFVVGIIFVRETKNLDVDRED